MMIDRYRLTFTHDIIDDGKIIAKVEEPKTVEFHNIDMADKVYSGVYRNSVLDRIFEQLLTELKKVDE